MSCYRRVTFDVRCQIDAFLQAGETVQSISSRLGYHKSTIYRELRRNRSFVTYLPHAAQKKADERYRRCRKPYKLKGHLLKYVCATLSMGWSPVQIAKRLKLEKSLSVSHECVYQCIKRNPRLKPYLRRPRKRGAGRVLQRRRLQKDRLSIRQRPMIANKRKRRGDWERDGMYVANHRQILVCTDRKTRYTKIAKLNSTSSKEVAAQTLKLLNSTKAKIYTITNDNGSEFRGAPLPIRTYYCDPLKPQQRGTVENTIGLLRQWLTRKTDIDQITDEEIKRIEDRLNFRPRKCLNFRTPFEAFYGRKVALVI